MSMAVTGFCCALEVWTQTNSDPMVTRNAVKAFKYLSIGHLRFRRCQYACWAELTAKLKALGSGKMSAFGT
jgi:hypothetical protein